MIEEIEVVCKCPTCERVYRQKVKGQWTGASRKVRGGQTALKALCEEAGQGKGTGVWVGYAYCSECSEWRLPPALKGSVGKWLQHGEQL